MRKFLNGERDFKQNEFVYVVNYCYSLPTKDKQLHNIKVGKVEGYAGNGNYYIDFLVLNRTKTLFGEALLECSISSKVFDIPEEYRKFDFVKIKRKILEQVYKEDIKRSTEKYDFRIIEDIEKCYNDGCMIEAKKLKDLNTYVDIDFSIKNKYKFKISTRSYGSSQYIRSYDRYNVREIFRSYKDAATYIAANNAERIRLANLTDEEYSWEEAEHILKKIPSDKAEYCRKQLLSMNNMANICLRRFDYKIQYNNEESKEWHTLVTLDKPEPIIHTEKYFFSVCKIYDIDQISFVKGYTNKSPEEIFKIYDSADNVIHISNLKYEESSNEPKFLYTGYYIDEKNEIVHCLNADYICNIGYFTINNCNKPTQWRFDISGGKYVFSNLGISIICKKTTITYEEICTLIFNAIKKHLGKWSNIFLNELQITMRKEIGQ